MVLLLDMAKTLLKERRVLKNGSVSVHPVDMRQKGRVSNPQRCSHRYEGKTPNSFLEFPALNRQVPLAFLQPLGNKIIIRISPVES